MTKIGKTQWVVDSVLPRTNQHTTISYVSLVPQD